MRSCQSTIRLISSIKVKGQAPIHPKPGPQKAAWALSVFLATKAACAPAPWQSGRRKTCVDDVSEAPPGAMRGHLKPGDAGMLSLRCLWQPGVGLPVFSRILGLLWVWPSLDSRRRRPFQAAPEGHEKPRSGFIIKFAAEFRRFAPKDHQKDIVVVQSYSAFSSRASLSPTRSGAAGPHGRAKKCF